MCGAPVPQEAFLPKPEKRSSLLQLLLGAVAVIAIISMVISRMGGGGGDLPPPIVQPYYDYETPAPLPVATPTAYGYEYGEYPDEYTPLGLPHEHITDPGLRQALELLFGQELHSVSWDAIDEIRALDLERDEVIFGFEGVNSIADLMQNGTLVRPDAEVSDFLQLRYLRNLDVLALGFGQVNQEILIGMPGLIELNVPSGRTVADLTPFAALPKLRRLTVSGRNLTGLGGISDLTNLYALGLTSTGITDLSVLSHQRNITELAFTDNRALQSFATLQDMYWLRALHIVRSTDRDLHFISSLENLEALTLVRTDTRTLNFILPLTNLRYLRLFDNRDVPTIPSLADFTQLTDLHVDMGSTTGTVRPAAFLEGVTTVRRMTLRNPDTLDGLSKMQHLEELDISFGWLLTDAAPLGALTNLRRLRIYDSRVFGSEVRNMNAIAQLSNLRQLDISDNDLYFYWDFIYQLENLEELNISRNNVIGNFSEISRLTNLRVLRMDRVRLMTSYSITRTGGMVGISFVGTSRVSDHAAALAQLTQLELLSVSRNELHDIGFVSNMTNLQVFLAEENFIEDVSPLAGLPELVLVDLRRNAVGNWGALDEMINTTIHGR